jgi:hypothetical protein
VMQQWGAGQVNALLQHRLPSIEAGEKEKRVATQTRTRPTKGRAQGGSCSLPEMQMSALLPEEDVHRPEEDVHRPAPEPYKA